MLFLSGDIYVYECPTSMSLIKVSHRYHTYQSLASLDRI